MTDRRIGVYVCACGGNISDYVDVARVRDVVEREPGVAVAKTHMFTCSDASQQEIIEDIRNESLDGLVVASCSPKLHLFTFRAMADRAGLNRYQYVQVNLREQCSWAHRDDTALATEKATRLVRAGIAKARLTEPLSTMRIETTPRVLVIGAGVTGLRAALALSEVGLSVFLVERSSEVGGWTRKWGKMFPHQQRGSDIVAELSARVRRQENVILFTNAEVVERGGSVGKFAVKIRVDGSETISLVVGAIIVSTGFDVYRPSPGEFGYGQDGVMTLAEFKELVDHSPEELGRGGRGIKDVVYINCVGSRQAGGGEGTHSYCSRYCCATAVHTALCAREVTCGPGPAKDCIGFHQFHLFRDMRTYGKHEIPYEDACRKGCIFMKYDDEDPPKVERVDGRLRVTVNDQLLGGEEVEIDADLVVLVTGMVPRENSTLVDVLKLPVGVDGFFNEVHPKLRPVETVVDGELIAGTAQGPKTLPESVASGLSAAAKAAALLRKGYVDLEPFIAEVDTSRCVWCGECLAACPYGAVEKTSVEGREVARILPSLCKGAGACVPVCPEDAIEVAGYTDAQVKVMIDELARAVAVEEVEVPVT
jgi:heterodisulfide reductase subunit A